MTRNRIVYLMLVVLLAGVAALSGAAVGGVVVYRTRGAKPASERQRPCTVEPDRASQQRFTGAESHHQHHRHSNDHHPGS